MRPPEARRAACTVASVTA